MSCYDPGTKTTPVQVSENKWAVDSFRGEARTYEIDLTPGHVSCSCPHWISRLSVQEHAECKHIQAVRQHIASQPTPTKLERAATVAAGLSDADLLTYAERHNGEAAGAACWLTLATRAAAEARDAELRRIFS